MFDGPSGRSALDHGQTVDDTLVRSMARLFLRTTSEAPEEAFLASTSRVHLMRRLSDTLLLYVRLDRGRNSNIGLVRLQMSQHLPE